MKISVVVPCRNDQRYLKGCLGSVIKQRPKPTAVVVVDDCSDTPVSRDDLPGKWGEFPIWLIRNEEKLGLAASRNIGVTLCGTPWFLPLDSDDMLTDNAFAIFSSISGLYPEVEVIQGGVEYFGEGIKTEHDLCKPLPMSDKVLMSKCPAHPTAAIKIPVWEKLGGYNEIGRAKHRGYEDWDFWIRVHQHSSGINVYQTVEPILKYRIRGGSKLSTQEYDAARVEMIVRYRTTWGCSDLAKSSLRELREYWNVQRLQER